MKLKVSTSGSSNTWKFKTQKQHLTRNLLTTDEHQGHDPEHACRGLCSKQHSYGS